MIKEFNRSEQSIPYKKGWELARFVEPKLIKSGNSDIFTFPTDLLVASHFTIPKGLKICLLNANEYIVFADRLAFDTGFILYFNQDNGLTIESLEKLLTWIESINE